MSDLIEPFDIMHQIGMLARDGLAVEEIAHAIPHLHQSFAMTKGILGFHDGFHSDIDERLLQLFRLSPAAEGAIPRRMMATPIRDTIPRMVNPR